MKKTLNVLIIEHHPMILERKKWLSKIEVTEYADISTIRTEFKFKIFLSHE